MRRPNKELAPEHARALIKQAIGIINGDSKILAEATAEIAVIQAAGLCEERLQGGQRRRVKTPPPRRT